jgi:dinuclear metal center YbgI/SA1388 family protein
MEAIVPSSRAESWDNVGLLLEPSGNPTISCVLLTIDLTEQVLREAQGLGAGLIVSYHPPIFHALKRLTQQSPKQRIIVQALECGMAVYSPHTALDAMEGGLNDWLLAGLGQGRVEALTVHSAAPTPDKLLSVYGVDSKSISCLGVSETATVKPSSSNPDLHDIEWPCTDRDVASLLLHLHTTIPSCHLSLHTRPETPVTGGGRMLTLDQAVSLPDLVACVKTHLSLTHVRLARPSSWTEAHAVATIATCAGSGWQILRYVKADVYLTGEMGHHDVLEATSRGTAVILCEHSNSEQGFLHIYRSLLQAKAGPDLTIVVAKSDCDPLVVT